MARTESSGQIMLDFVKHDQECRPDPTSSRKYFMNVNINFFHHMPFFIHLGKKRVFTCFGMSEIGTRIPQEKGMRFNLQKFCSHQKSFHFFTMKIFQGR